MIYEIPSSLIIGFVKPMPVEVLSSISGNILSSDLRASLFLTPVGFFSSSVSYLHRRLIYTRFSHKTRASPSIYELHVGHSSLPFMDAPQNWFTQLTLTFSGASAITFSRINLGHWSNFESLRSVDPAHIFPPLNPISAPQFPHQQFPTVDLCRVFSWPLISRSWDVDFPLFPFRKLLLARFFS